MEEFPNYPGDYAGVSMQNTGTQGGYGTATSGDLTMSANYLMYGIYG